MRTGVEQLLARRHCLFGGSAIRSSGWRTSRRIVASLAVVVSSVHAAASSAGSPAPAPAAGGASHELLVYAAASLRDALTAVAPGCERAGEKIVFNFGASNDLARQIEAAGKADVFFSADEIQM